MTASQTGIAVALFAGPDTTGFGVIGADGGAATGGAAAGGGALATTGDGRTTAIAADAGRDGVLNFWAPDQRLSFRGGADDRCHPRGTATLSTNSPASNSTYGHHGLRWFDNINWLSRRIAGRSLKEHFPPIVRSESRTAPVE